MSETIKAITLPSGLRVIIYPLNHIPALNLLVLFGVGAKYEKKEQSGISHFLEHMVFKGSKKRPKPGDIALALDKVGGIYNAFTSKEYIGFWVKVRPEHLDLAGDVLSDMIFNPVLDQTELEKERKVILEEINMLRDDPPSYVVELFEKLLYGEQPAGQSILGTAESLTAMTRWHLADFLSQAFASQNAIIALTGRIESRPQISEKVAKFFKDFTAKQAPHKARVTEQQNRSQLLLHPKKTDQTHLCLGVRTFPLGDERRYALAVLANALGGAMSSRLFVEFREKRSLGYYVSASAEHYTDSGYLATQAGADNNRVEEAIEVILAEYRKIATIALPPDELERAKETVKSKLMLGLETTSAWASFLGLQELLLGRIYTPQYESAMIDKVGQEDVLAVAQEIFKTEKLNLAVIGPFGDSRKFEKILAL